MDVGWAGIGDVDCLWVAVVRVRLLGEGELDVRLGMDEPTEAFSTY